MIRANLWERRRQWIMANMDCDAILLSTRDGIGNHKALTVMFKSGKPLAIHNHRFRNSNNPGMVGVLYRFDSTGHRKLYLVSCFPYAGCTCCDQLVRSRSRSNMKDYCYEPISYGSQFNTLSEVLSFLQDCSMTDPRILRSSSTRPIDRCVHLVAQGLWNSVDQIIKRYDGGENYSLLQPEFITADQGTGQGVHRSERFGGGFSISGGGGGIIGRQVDETIFSNFNIEIGDTPPGLSINIGHDPSQENPPARPQGPQENVRISTFRPMRVRQAHPPEERHIERTIYLDANGNFVYRNPATNQEEEVLAPDIEVINNSNRIIWNDLDLEDETLLSEDGDLRDDR
jgi:hypothetical protein